MSFLSFIWLMLIVLTGLTGLSSLFGGTEALGLVLMAFISKMILILFYFVGVAKAHLLYKLLSVGLTAIFAGSLFFILS